MKERGISFSAPMVRAILEGRKTQTRRAVKPQPDSMFVSTLEPYWNIGGLRLHKDATNRLTCPYGPVGRRLWVRETWQHANYPLGPYQPGATVFYRAEYCNSGDDPDTSIDGRRRKWVPAIHMPRLASRITLEVIAVGVERLQHISEEDAIAEGLSCLTKDGGQVWKCGIPDRDGMPGNDDHGWHWKDWSADPRAAYRMLWESIHGPGSWGANPFVWRIEFRRAGDKQEAQ